MRLEFSFFAVGECPTNDRPILGSGKDVRAFGIKAAIDQRRAMREILRNMHLFRLRLHGMPRFRQDFLDGLERRISNRKLLTANLEALAAVQDEREILIKKLQKLGELKDKGMLSDDEFTIAKAQLLN